MPNFNVGKNIKMLNRDVQEPQLIIEIHTITQMRPLFEAKAKLNCRERARARAGEFR